MAGMFWIFVEAPQLGAGQVRIAGPQGHHLGRVLRVRPGEQGVVVADDREFRVEVTEVKGSVVLGRIVGDRPIGGEPAIDVALLQALLPNPDFDAVIEAGTAVGISRFVAVEASRSVARPAAARLTRWQLITGSAAEQSHRGRVPEVLGPMTLASALAREAGNSRLLVLDPAASTPLDKAIDPSPAYALAVGPEGGWTQDELSLMAQHGGVAVNLGPRILRARLAPIVAAAILVQRS
jgi:16S rRNA (uracil1498-N3)-methyltransferase